MAEPLGTGLALGASVGRALGPSTKLSLDVGRLWLGKDSEDGFRPGLPPYFPSGFYHDESRQGLWHLSLRLDQRLFRAPVTPSVLLSVGAYGLQGGYQYTLRDSLTSEIVRHTDTRGLYWGPGLSTGLSLTFPSIGPRLTPRLEGRIHASAMKAEESWTTYQAFTIGLAIAW